MSRLSGLRIIFLLLLGHVLAAQPNAGYDLTEFSELRAMRPGQIRVKGYIDCVVVSDPGSKNICSSPQTGQFKFDRTENDRTAYVESLDGKYGLCLKFASAADNTLKRYARVMISIEGLKLVRNPDPEYYVLQGVKASNILMQSAPNIRWVPLKKKRICELVDDDIFTLTGVTGLEILRKDGCFTNCPDNFTYKDETNKVGLGSARWDVAPLLCYDSAGDAIAMLTNAAVPWRRGSQDRAFWTILPQGSGTFWGIVVADDIVTVRYGDCGRYQLRAMVKEDIALTDEPFSATIVEWNWNNGVTDLVPEVGDGRLKSYGATLGASFDFNNTSSDGLWDNSGTTTKGRFRNGGINLSDIWWDFKKDEGKYFDISFSTKGIVGESLIFGIDWGHGSMNATSVSGAAHWKLLYSIDGGKTFSEVPDCPILKKRSIIWGLDSPQDATPGYTEHLRRLPDECFDKSKVVLRLQVADKVTDIGPDISTTDWRNNLGIEKGILDEDVTAANCQNRIVFITIRYSKKQ